MARLTPDLLCLGLVKSIPCPECGHVCSAVSDRALARFVVDHCQYDLFKFAAEAMGLQAPRSER